MKRSWIMVAGIALMLFSLVLWLVQSRNHDAAHPRRTLFADISPRVPLTVVVVAEHELLTDGTLSTLAHHVRDPWNVAVVVLHKPEFDAGALRALWPNSNIVFYSYELFDVAMSHTLEESDNYCVVLPDAAVFVRPFSTQSVGKPLHRDTGAVGLNLGLGTNIVESADGRALHKPPPKQLDMANTYLSVSSPDENVLFYDWYGSDAEHGAVFDVGVVVHTPSLREWLGKHAGRDTASFVSRVVAKASHGGTHSKTPRMLTFQYSHVAFFRSEAPRSKLRDLFNDGFRLHPPSYAGHAGKTRQLNVGLFVVHELGSTHHVEM